jgi:hypothetical protein
MVFGAASSDASEVPEAYRGAYPSYAACLAELPSQTQLFEKATKLIAVVAACEPAKAIPSTFVLRLESFGQPAARLFVFNAFSEAATPETLSQGRAFLAQSGAQIVKENGGTFFYYAPRAIGLKHHILGKFRDAEECAAQRADAEAISRQAGAKTVLSSCIASIYGSLVNLETLSDLKAWVSSDYGYNSPDYFSAAECLQDKERVIAQARARGGRAILGALCLPEVGTPDSYKANLFTIL